MSEAPIERDVEDLDERVAFLFPGFGGTLDDLEDENTRLGPIEGEHPQDPDQAPDAWRIHTSMHLIVANQVLGNNPPEVWATLQRIVAKGFSRHDALHMVAAGMSEIMYHTVRGRPQSPAVYLQYLAGLPEQSVRNKPTATSRTGGSKPRQQRRR